MSADVTLNAKIQRFLKWFECEGGSFHPDVELVHNTERGIHLRARKAMRPTDEKLAICTCPFQTSISPVHHEMGKEVRESLPRVNRSASGPVTRTLADSGLEHHVLGYFMLLEEKMLGEESYWYPYIDLLPRIEDMTTPLFFADEDLKWLIGTTMHTTPSKSAVGDRRELRRREWQKAMEILHARNIEGSRRFTFEQYLWASTIFTSRAFAPSAAWGPGTLDTCSILYPGIDLANHSPRAKVAWDFRSGEFTLSTLQLIERGEEIFNNYAPKGNEELLMGYGFTRENNPTDTLRVVLPPPPPRVHLHLRAALPDHFKSESWTSEEASFLLRGSDHVSGPYDHGIRCLRGVPYAMFRMMAELIYFMSTGESDGAGEAMQDGDFFAYVIEQFLVPLRQRRDAISVIDSQPQNLKQSFAKVYRDGQIRILDEVIADLERFLSHQDRDDTQ